MTKVRFDPLLQGETRRYQITVTSSTLDLTTATSFVFQVRSQYNTPPLITKTILAANFDSVSTSALVVSVTLTSDETVALGIQTYMAGGEVRVGTARYAAVEGQITVQPNPVSV